MCVHAYTHAPLVVLELLSVSLVFIKFGKFMAKISSNIFYMPSSHSQPLGTPIIHVRLLEGVP